MEKEKNQAQMAADVLRRNDEFLASKFGEQGVRPISSIDDLISLGLATDDKTLTPEGQRYKALVDKGFINKDGSKTTDGEALSIDINDLTDPTQFLETGEIDEKKADLYDTAKKLGRFKEPEKPISQVFSELKEGVSALGKGAYSFIVSPEVKEGETAEETAQRDVVKMYEAADSIIENLVVGASKTARFLDKQLSFDNQLAKLDLLPEELKQDQVKAEKRKNFRVALIERAHKDKTALDLAEAIGTADEFIKAKESTIGQYVSQYGEQEGPKKYEEDVSNVRAAAAIPADVPGTLVAAGTVGLGAGISLIKNADKARKISQGMSILSHGQELNTARTAVAATAAKLADEASIVSGQLDDALRIGATEKAAELTTKLDNLTAQSQAVQTRLSIIDDGIENVSKTANQLEIGLETAQEAKDIARLAASRTTGALSSGAESLGNGIAKFNGFLSKVERKVSRGKIPWIISTALAIPFGKALGGYITGRLGLLASVPVLRKMGNFGRVMSEEMLERTSSTPFFRRVAANESIGGLGRAVATLGDYSTPLAKGFAGMAKGTAQAAPATFSYNAINSQGIDENTLKYAARDALVFGSLGRVLGGKKDMEKVNIDQMTNYRNKLDADQIAVFDGLKDRDFRYALSGIDAAYPGMFKWDLKTTGNNLFDPGNRRAVVNINDKAGFLKEVAMHEAGHMIQHVWQNDAMIVSRMLGDDTQPGLVRNPDGTLDAEFKAWADEYNNLREQNDLAPVDLNELAVEYYTEQGIQTLLDDVLKGKMYKEARKTPLRRVVENSFRTVFNATPIVKNLHFKLGGATDATGRMVMGTGLLADGFRELPEVKSMVRQMYRETAGKPKAMRPQKIVDVASENPKHYEANTVIDEVNKQLVERGEKLPEGALVPDKNGNGEGVLTDDYFKTLEERGVIDEGDYSKASFFQAAMDAPQKHGVLLVNKPIAQGRSEQFGGLAEGYVIPTKWILKKGRLYVEAMDLRQLDKNVDRAVKNKIAKELGMTRKKIYEDIEKSVELQNKGQASDSYYQSVDSKNWKKRKNFINSVLGLQTNRQLGINPMMKKVSPDLVTGIYRTFAFDRIQSVIRSGGDVVIPFGQNSYYSIRDNLLPQTPRFNRNGDLVMPEKKLRVEVKENKLKASKQSPLTPRKSETKYRNPTLAKGIQFAISGQSREREQTK